VSLNLAVYGEIVEDFGNEVSPQRIVEKLGLQIANLSSEMAGDQIVNGQL